MGTTEKIPSDTTGNRSRDLPTSSAVPYPYKIIDLMKISINYVLDAEEIIIIGSVVEVEVYLKHKTNSAEQTAWAMKK